MVERTYDDHVPVLARPDWWPDWVPLRCGGCGWPWVPVAVSVSWAHCSCAGASEAHGHEVWYCAAVRVWPRAPRCHWHVWPPEHDAAGETPERPRQL